MNTFWHYFLPILGAGFLIGAITGLIGFRSLIVRPRDRVAGDKLVITPGTRRRRQVALAAGLAAVLASAVLWHGPFSAADRFTSSVEADARDALHDLEMTKVTAHLHRGLLTRRLLLAKPADYVLTDFQSSELVRLMGQVKGVSGATWSTRSAGLPLIAEGILAAIAGFLPGLLVAYVAERRRRHNAQWTW